jgi:Cu(I)/Ag(I) efflux system membrane fusion protein
VQILKGLAEGEKVVVAANFLLDSESSLKAALQDFAAPASGASPRSKR